MMTPYKVKKDVMRVLPAILPYLYEYPYDFTPYASVMAEQVVDKQPTQSLADALAKVSGNPWKLGNDSPYSLSGATVFYAGPNAPAFATSKRFKYAVGVKLGPQYQFRNLYLVFNII